MKSQTLLNILYVCLTSGYYADPELECQAYHVCLQVNILIRAYCTVYTVFLGAQLFIYGLQFAPYSILSRVSEPEPPRAGVFGWSWSRHFGPAPAPP